MKADMVHLIGVCLKRELDMFHCALRYTELDQVHGTYGVSGVFRVSHLYSAWRGVLECSATREEAAISPMAWASEVAAELRALVLSSPEAEALERKRLTSVKTFATVGKWRRWSQPCAS